MSSYYAFSMQKAMLMSQNENNNVRKDFPKAKRV